MKLSELCENVVNFETGEAKAKRKKKDDQMKNLKSIDHTANQKKLNIMANRSQIKSVE